MPLKLSFDKKSMMSKMDGYEVCRETLKKFDILIIMLTAKAGSLTAVLGLELGVDDYMMKPFSPRELETGFWSFRFASVKDAVRRFFWVDPHARFYPI